MKKTLCIPEREFGPAPWWAWMGEPTNATVDRDLKRFLAMEIHEVIIIPLYGLKPEYMGREYLELYRHACRRCRQWGMKIWIYDEFNWPSGTCAGKVLRQFPRFRQHALEINADQKTSGGRAQAGWRIVENKKFQLAAYGAEWARGETGYLDTLNPEAVRAYIEMTHEAYKRELGEFFGDVIVGFFTDEPVMLASGVGFPYTPALFDLFQREYGYDLRKRLPALTSDAPDALRVRRDYWSLVGTLFKNAFFRQYAEWCAAHGLKMTGHLLHEESLASCVNRNGDMFDVLAEMQVPGIDLLRGVASFDAGRVITAAESMKRDITGKLIESIAYFAEKDRTLCEAFGCLTNQVTMVDYKRAADFLFHHGLSLINDNLFADSLGSFRKFCGCHAMLTPWVKHYKLFSRHIRAMSYLNSGSRLLTEVGLYYPGMDARARYAPPRSLGLGPNFMMPDWDATQRSLYDMAHGLLRRHWDYYLVFDRILKSAVATPGGLRMRDFKCRALIFPDIHYVDSETAAALRRFTRAGGTMICVGRVPLELDASGLTRKTRWGKPERVVLLPLIGDAIVAEVARVLRERFKPPVKINGAGADDVMLTLRHTRAGELLLLTNFGDRAAEIDVEIAGAWRELNTVANTTGDLLAVRECLLPGESKTFMRVGKAGKRNAGAKYPASPAALSDNWKLRLPAGNVIFLPLMVFTGQTSRPPAASANTWKGPCRETAPMNFIPEKNYWLRREVDVNYKPRRLELVLDGYDECEVFVNRRRLSGVPTRTPLWDDANRVCDIRGAVRRGCNEILIKYKPARIRKFVSLKVPLSDMPPVVLRGDFLAASRLDRTDITPMLAALPGRVETGNLQPRGYPNFAGVAEYVQTIKLNKIPGKVMLDMGRQNDLFEVKINGRSAGVLGWPPYRLEVGALLRRGDNRLVFRMYTALGGVLTKFYGGEEKGRVPVGMRETPVLYGF